MALRTTTVGDATLSSCAKTLATISGLGPNDEPLDAVLLHILMSDLGGMADLRWRADSCIGGTTAVGRFASAYPVDKNEASTSP